MKSPAKVEFDLPKGFTLPEGTEPGGEFYLVCTFKLRKGNRLCLIELGDFDMPGYEDEDDPEPTKYGRAREQLVGEAQMGGE